MHLHPVAATTHTVELQQIAEINDHLASPPHGPVTACDAGLDGAVLTSGGSVGPGTGHGSGAATLPGYAVLVRVEASGPPEYPYLRAHFDARPWRTGDLVVDLHTTTLVALSHRLDLRHRWGAR